MSQHTPGPWKAGRPDMATLVEGVDSKWIYGGKSQDSCVAVASGRASDDWNEVMANARLIAAAPDLLEALEPLASQPCDMHLGRSCTMVPRGETPLTPCPSCVARAAIAKAKGEA